MRDEVLWVCARNHLRPTQVMEYFYGSPHHLDDVREAIAQLVHEEKLILTSDRHLVVATATANQPTEGQG